MTTLTEAPAPALPTDPEFDLPPLPPADATPAERAWCAYLWISQFPDEWDQEKWGLRTECGTVYCFAGHVVRQAGFQPKADWNPYNNTFDLIFVRLATLPETLAAEILCMSYARVQRLDEPEKRQASVSLVAEHLLGISHEAGEELFHARNSLEDIRAILREIFGPNPFETTAPVR